MHVDVGTGPGLFNWVMYDSIQQYFRPQHRPQLMLLGYDHCPNMLGLASRIWDKFNLEDQIYYSSKAKRIVRAVENISNDNVHLIVTFGHVLIQAYKQEEDEIARFARLCGKLSQSKLTTDIIAVDAYGGYRKAHFKRAATKLFEELEDYSEPGVWRQAKIHDSILRKGSRALIRNWGES